MSEGGRSLGKKDEALAVYLDDKTRYADLVDGIVFHGEQVVKPEDVEENRERFERLEEDAYDVIAALTNSSELTALKEQYREEGSGINMCQAIREMIEDGRMEGRAQGEVVGENRINELNRRLLSDGRQNDLIRAVQDAKYQKELLREYKL